MVYNYPTKVTKVETIIIKILNLPPLLWQTCRLLDQKTYYLESDVEKFIKERFGKNSTFEG
jgi:hypothetical protein